jgi:hypothetical protein
MGKSKTDSVVLISKKPIEQQNIVVPIVNEINKKQLVKRVKHKSTDVTITATQKSSQTQNKGPNVILHLKCKISELHEYQKIVKKFENNYLIYEPVIPNNNYVPYEDVIEHNYSSYVAINTPFTINNDNETNVESNVASTNVESNVASTENICEKLKDLKLQLYKNVPINKQCCCFWCSYEYKDDLCYIPKHIINDVIYGYGSFCTPQCAAAYLIKENIDDTTRYERYYLLNYIYGNGKCIKPSPNPFYTLEKYYGNLTIDEYRNLITKNKHLYITIDKPMTRIFPEIHEEIEESLMGNKESKIHNNNSNNNSRVYKVKMQNDPPQPTNDVQNMVVAINKPKNPFQMGKPVVSPVMATMATMATI